MDNNTKAKALIDAVSKTVDELRSEGKTIMAAQTEKAFKDIPVGSLAKLYDIIQANATRKDALRSLGADA
jgi:hypothetical protein